MKTKLIETKFQSALSFVSRLFSKVACLGAAILICSGTSAQNLFVSGGISLDSCGFGKIYEFTWDGTQSIFASTCNPTDVAFDNAGNLYVVNWEIVRISVQVSIYKYTPNGVGTIFASGLSLPSYLSVDRAGNVFVADNTNGIIYKYTSTGSRTTFASGLYHPVGMAFDSAGNLFVADNTNDNIQGSIYKYAPDGSRVTFAVLDPADRPADLAFDSIGNLYMADLGGNIYEYHLGILRRYPRTIFGSVPNSAQSLAWDSSGNLFVVDVGGDMIYKFTSQAVRTPFASGQTLHELFAYLAIQPPLCCQ
jgi:DNA-binding beta-propeller fold protein YncE